jgi:hypothetical protein
MNKLLTYLTDALLDLWVRVVGTPVRCDGGNDA